MRIQHLIGLAFFALSTAFAADITGDWTGSMLLNDGNDTPAYLHLTQKGSAISGTQGSSKDHQFPITTGGIDGEQVSIEARPGRAILKLTMKLDGANLSGDVFEDDRKIGTVSVKRVN